eukprot:scaffold4825_cov347-Prasinococcus_capsulatus_cf.AAC.2
MLPGAQAHHPARGGAAVAGDDGGGVARSVGVCARASACCAAAYMCPGGHAHGGTRAGPAMCAAAVPVRVEKLLQDCCGWSKELVQEALRLRIVALHSEVPAWRAPCVPHAAARRCADCVRACRSPRIRFSGTKLHSLRQDALLTARSQLVFPAERVRLQPCGLPGDGAGARSAPPEPLLLPSPTELEGRRRCYALHKPSGAPGLAAGSPVARRPIANARCLHRAARPCRGLQ